MVQIEYQLTFEEYREGFLAAQQRYTKRLQADQRKNWVSRLGATTVGIGVALGLLYFMSWHSVPFDPAPHLFWVLVIVVFFVLVVVLARKQRRDVARRVWDDLPNLQQPKRVTFDDGGIRIADPLSDTSTKWTAFKRMDETSHLFLLCISDLGTEMFPKRAFNDAAAAEFRQLVSVKLAAPTGGFPVIAMSDPT